MRLDSNIQGVLDRVKLRPRDIRQALARTLAPAEWDATLRAEAKRTVWVLAKPAEWGFVELRKMRVKPRVGLGRGWIRPPSIEARILE